MKEYKQPKNAIVFTKTDNKIIAHITCPICMCMITSQFMQQFPVSTIPDEESQMIYQNLASVLNKLLLEHIHSHWGSDNWGHIKIVQLEINDPMYGHVVQLVKNRLNRMSFLLRLKFLFTRKTQII